MPFALRPAAVLAVGLWASAGAAQQIDCAAAVAQVELTWCAEQDYLRADAELNAAYAAAVAAARQMDAAGGAGAVPVAEMLRDAQRAWIPFRDAACAAEAQVARGGSIMGQITHQCLARVTRGRTLDLTIFARGLQ
ncbi:DUF1311 domain-containing protein [Rhodobacteraceae bacterium CCMM004]|nr:DUF1311 domain-containing protein [Rhodobacteraceae bacterium CCMM004]